MGLGFRISPAWWPALGLLSPVIAPLLVQRALRFRRGRQEATERNRRRIDLAEPLELPPLQSMGITVVVEHAHEKGFLSDSAVSYLVDTDRGSLLMDIGFGLERPAFKHNIDRLGLSAADVQSLMISHLHLDHMGGLAAQRSRRITSPLEPVNGSGEGERGLIPCYVPDSCSAEGLEINLVDGPHLLNAGLATTGPLARMLFFFGLMEEQALVAHLEGKGLVILTGCGHPTIEIILKMARQLSNEPLYAIGGGLHFPITRSRGSRLGIEPQQLFGTGKPVWDRIDDDDLSHNIEILNQAAPRRVLLSAHDTCDHAIQRLTSELDAKVDVLSAGATFSL